MFGEGGLESFSAGMGLEGFGGGVVEAEGEEVYLLLVF